MVKLKDKEFIPYISEKALKARIKELGDKIGYDYSEKYPLFLGVLNGSFMFMSDLVKEMDIPMEVSFIKIASYVGEVSTGVVKEIIGLEENLKGRDVLIVEDIVDTGLSIDHVLRLVNRQEPKSVAVASLLLKSNSLKKPVKVDYIGFEIAEKFVVGYGLDYDGLGRNLKEIYQLK